MEIIFILMHHFSFTILRTPAILAIGPLKTWNYYVCQVFYQKINFTNSSKIKTISQNCWDFLIKKNCDYFDGDVVMI